MGLTLRQRQFIARRLMTVTDAEAASQLTPPLPISTLSDWKEEQPDFKQAYDDMGSEAIENAKAMASIALGAAMMTLVEAATGATKTTRQGTQDHDWAARLEAAKAILAVHGVSTNKGELDTVTEMVVKLVRDEKAASSE